MKKLGSVLMIVAMILAVSGAVFAAGKTHDMTVEIVSIDAKAKTITVKGEAGDKTVPLMGAAITEAKNFKPGDKVVVSCQDNEKGEHEGVKAIKKAAA
jgi:aspartate 1-decarboxylase